MKQILMRRGSRFPTAQAYASVLSSRGGGWVERSAKILARGEPAEIAIARVPGPTANAVGTDTSVGRSFRRDDIEAICGNPLRDPPNPVVVKAVTRFGFVGLVACALCTGVARWWHSLSPRKY